jgi:hypothetical protein
MAASSIPPIGTRFALRDRADGTVLCVVRTDRRIYEYESRAAGGEWLRLRWTYDTSINEALQRVDWLAQVDTDRWHNVCRDIRPSPLP